MTTNEAAKKVKKLTREINSLVTVMSTYAEANNDDRFFRRPTLDCVDTLEDAIKELKYHVETYRAIMGLKA